LLCLHEWGAHEHPSLMSPDHGTAGNGLLLFFLVDDFDLALQRARSLVTRLEATRESEHFKPRSSRSEIRTDITLRSVHSLRPDKALQLPSAGRGFMGQRHPTWLPSPGGSAI